MLERLEKALLNLREINFTDLLQELNENIVYLNKEQYDRDACSYYHEIERQLAAASMHIANLNYKLLLAEIDYDELEANTNI